MKPRTYRLRLKVEELEHRDAPSGAVAPDIMIIPPPVIGCFLATPAGLLAVPAVMAPHNPNVICFGG